MVESRDAESLFVDWLSRRDAGDALPIAWFAAKHPSAAHELLYLHREWSRIAGAAAGTALVQDGARHDLRPDLERYRIEEALGNDGATTLLRVYDSQLRRELAMRVLPDASPEDIARFKKDAWRIARLEHQAILPVHELGTDRQGRAFATTRLVSGWTLREILADGAGASGSWSLPRLVMVLVRVCDALAFAHEKGTFHRALGADDVVVSRHGEVFVTNWDRPHERNGHDDARDDQHSDARADIRAIGLLLRSVPGDTPPILAGIAARATNPNAREPYSTIGELRDDLRAWIEDGVAGSRTPTALHVARTKRSRAIAVAASAVTVVALAISGWRVLDATEVAKTARSDAATAIAAAAERVAAAEATAARELRRAADRVDVFRLADASELRGLEARGAALLADRAAIYTSVRGFDSLLAALRSWIEEAEALAARLPEHEAKLAELEARGRRVPGRDTLEFTTADDAWWHASLRELVDGLRALSLGERVSIPAVRDRATECEAIFAHSVGAHRAEWQECARSIGDESECPAYHGFSLAPQVGLLPLGRDPKSGLHEFWFVDTTGSAPRRDRDGRLELADDFGLVFVLVPGGNLPTRGDDAGIEIPPFFLSKYEMTEHQWLVGSNDFTWPYGGVGTRLPATSLSFDDATAGLAPLGLGLPNAAQWEYACRAGTRTPWSSGADAKSLAGVANLRDRWKAGNGERELVVGSLDPNPFGLHDMHGNVWEWCADATIRGGSSWSGADDARCDASEQLDRTARETDTGVRPMRDVRRE